MSSRSISHTLYLVFRAEKIKLKDLLIWCAAYTLHDMIKPFIGFTQWNLAHPCKSFHLAISLSNGAPVWNLAHPCKSFHLAISLSNGAPSIRQTSHPCIWLSNDNHKSVNGVACEAKSPDFWVQSSAILYNMGWISLNLMTRIILSTHRNFTTTLNTS